MKMPAMHSNENGHYDYENNSYYGENELDNLNNGIDDFESPADDVFSEYLWMENEEEFDNEVMQRLEEEALMEQCIEAMLADETPDSTTTGRSNAESNQTKSSSTTEVTNLIGSLKIEAAEVAKGSNLNPLAAEFVPGAPSAPRTRSS